MNEKHGIKFQNRVLYINFYFNPDSEYYKKYFVHTTNQNVILSCQKFTHNAALAVTLIL